MTTSPAEGGPRAWRDPLGLGEELGGPARLAQASAHGRDGGRNELEEVTFVFGTIAWTYAEGGVTDEDAWGK